MNGVLVVAVFSAATWVILHGIRDWHNDVYARRRRNSFLTRHQVNVRHDQIEREIRENGWRR